MDLAYVFLWCAVCGYGMSILMFVWPAYRLLAIFLLVLNFFSWRFASSLGDFKVSLSAKALQRKLDDETRSRNRELERLVAEKPRAGRQRTAGPEAALVASRTDNAVVITDTAGRIEWVNDGFTRMTGYQLDEVLGRSPARCCRDRKPTRQRSSGSAGACITPSLWKPRFATIPNRAGATGFRWRSSRSATPAASSHNSSRSNGTSASASRWSRSSARPPEPTA